MVILNAHGGNQFQPLVRDLQSELPIFLVVANFFQMAPEVKADAFEVPGDHADEMETSLMLHLFPDLVELEEAGPGERSATVLDRLKQSGVWTPRPWSRCHPDTGSGDPSRATAEKGVVYFEAVAECVAKLLVTLGEADREALLG